MPTIPFIGIVNVPLFDSDADMSFLTTYDTPPTLNPYSDWALIQKSVQSAHAGSVDSMFSYVFGIDVEENRSLPSIFSVNPGETTTTDGFANYIDGNVCYAQEGATGGSFDIFIAVQPIEPGDYGNSFRSYNFTNSTMNGTNLIIGGEMLNNNSLTKMNYNFEPCFGGFYAPGTGADDTFVPAPFYVNIGGPVVDFTPEFTGLNTTTNFPNAYVTARIAREPVFSPFASTYDNAAVTNYGDQNYYLTWNSVSGGYSFNELSINDTGLPGGLNELMQQTAPRAWNNGFLWIVQTLGDGPTGQQFEFIFMDAKASQWWLVRLLPQDATSGAALAETATTGWQATVDPIGIFWFNPLTDPTASKMFYSYSPLEFFFPWLYPQDLLPVTLPCYSTCNPVKFCD